eukprot:5284034-Prymnesium_polylepis.3
MARFGGWAFRRCGRRFTRFKLRVRDGGCAGPAISAKARRRQEVARPFGGHLENANQELVALQPAGRLHVEDTRNRSDTLAKTDKKLDFAPHAGLPPDGSPVVDRFEHLSTPVRVDATKRHSATESSQRGHNQHSDKHANSLLGDAATIVAAHIQLGEVVSVAIRAIAKLA